MNKVVLSIISGILIFSAILPLVIFAEEGVPSGCTMKQDVGISGCPSQGSFCAYSNPQCGVCCLMNTIYNVTNWLFIFMIAIAVIFIIIGGFTFLTSAGDAEKTQKGRNYIMYAAIGIVIGLLAKAVPSLVRMIVGA
jgi:hypothetical protein